MQNETKKNVLKTCISTGSTTGELLLTIKGAAFSYSVLKDWGYRMHYPIAVVTENIEIGDEIIDKLAIFATRILSTNMPPGEFLKAMSDGHDDVCVMSYTQGRYLSGNMETMFSFCQCGEYGGCEMKVLLLVIFPKVVPAEYNGKFSLVIEVNRNQLENLSRTDMEAYLDTLKNYILGHEQVIHHEINKNLQSKFIDKDIKFWSAVVIMLGLVFSDGKEACEEKSRKYLYDLIQSAYDLAGSYEFNSQIPALFRDAFDKSIPELSRLIPETRAGGLPEQDLLGMVLYDLEHYYIPDGLFAKICKPLSDVCTVNQIKAVLATEGILCTQGQGRIYRTIKKKVGSLNIPVRYVWLKREALEGNIMEMSFLDIYLIRERRRNA